MSILKICLYPFVLLVMPFLACFGGIPQDPTSIALAGTSLSDKAVQQLEEGLKSNPNDITARTKLLGYYTRKYNSVAKLANILWFIENRPDASVLESGFVSLDKILEKAHYEEAKKAWLTVVEKNPSKVIILGNAANFLTLYDSELAEQTFKKAKALEPKNPKWASRLGHLYALGLSSLEGSARQKAAKKALAEYSSALQNSTHSYERISLLSRAGMLAVELGQLNQARLFGKELLRIGDGDGDAVHKGHTILGRIALRTGGMEAAKSHLLASGKTTGSPVLGSFGPNMTLAQELLEKGERKSVLQYFGLCAKFWQHHDGILAQWTKEVRTGQTPDFGANLDY